MNRGKIMEQIENLLKLLAHVQEKLNKAGIQSMVFGGISVVAWGRPRFTQDVDLKILLTRDEAGRLLECMAPEYRPDDTDPELKFRTLGFLFFRDPFTNIRIDLVIAETGFDIEALSRSRQVEMMPGITLTLCSPEDLIIYKLISTRPRDNDDIPGIIIRQNKSLDDVYIEKWLREFELAFDDSTLVASYQKLRYRNS
jgi:hypothetical protein